MKLNYFCKFTLLFLTMSIAHADDDLYGVWEPIEYNIAGEALPLRGVMIITPGYFVGNTTFDIEGDGVLEANANSGPITVENGVIKLMQWMQLHWRVNDHEGHFLREDIPEEIHYTISEDRLFFHFPSGNTYISQRLSE